MTRATTAKPKRDTRKTCSICKVKYQPTHRSTLTCSNECKQARRNNSGKAATRKKRQPKPLPMSNAFIQLLLRHARQTETVQIVQYITSDQLLELREMQKVQHAVNSRSLRAFAEYHFSHIYPVKGKAHTGKLVPHNLIVGNATLNRAHGNHYYSGGDFISSADKSAKWNIQSWMTDADIITLMVECIGQPVWDAFTKVAKLVPSQRQSHLDTLGTLLDRSNPEHKDYIKVYDNPKTSTPDLRALIEAVTDETTFVFGGVRYMSPMDVLITETARMMVYRPELSPVLQALEQIEQTSLYFTYDSFDLGDDESFFFNILHGRDIAADVLAEVVTDALTQATSAIKTFDKVVYLRPIDSYTPEQLEQYHAMVAAHALANTVSEQIDPDAYCWLSEAIALQEAA